MSVKAQIVRFGDVCSLDRVQNKGAALPYVGLEDIVSGEGRFTGNSEPKRVQSSTFKFTPEHILYGRLRPYLNKVYLPDFNGHCSTEIFPIRPASNADRRYLYYWLSMESTVKEIDRTSTGARMPRANVDTILEFPIPLPPLPEQQRIVAILDEAFAGLATATAYAEKNLKNARELFHSVSSIILERGWPTATLESLLVRGRKISYGVLKPGKHDPAGIRLIKSQQVRDGSMDLTDDFRITKELDEEYSRTRLQGGEILLNLVGASIGRSAIAPDEIKGANVSRAIAVIPVRSEFSSWIQYNLSGLVGQKLIRGRTGGAAQPVLNLGEVKLLPIPLPPEREREEALGKLDLISTSVARAETIYRKKIRTIGELREVILQKVFSGKLTSRPSQAVKEAAE